MATAEDPDRQTPLSRMPNATPTTAPETQHVGPTVTVIAKHAAFPTEQRGGQAAVLRDAGDLSALGAFWEVVKRIPSYARLIAAMTRDPDVPPAAKASLIAGGTYLVSPVDLIPGIIPVAGQIDDLYVVLTALQLAIKACPQPVVARHLAAQNLHSRQIEHDLGVIRRLVRVGARKVVAVSTQVMTQATRRAAHIARAARTRLAQRGTDAS